jgi:hypothetical protein
MAGVRSDPDGAIATKHNGDFVGRNRIADAASGVPDDLDDLAQVLRPTIVAIGAPSPRLAISVVANLNAKPPQGLDKSHLPKGSRRLLLTWSKRPGTGRHTD